MAGARELIYAQERKSMYLSSAFWTDRGQKTDIRSAHFLLNICSRNKFEIFTQSGGWYSRKGKITETMPRIHAVLIVGGKNTDICPDTRILHGSKKNGILRYLRVQMAIQEHLSAQKQEQRKENLVERICSFGPPLRTEKQTRRCTHDFLRS